MSVPVETRELPAEVVLRALEEAGEGIAVIDGEDPAQPIAWANRAFEKSSGFALSQLRGSSLRLLQGTDQDQAELVELGEAMTRQVACTARLRSYRPDGSMYRHELRIAPLRDAGGRLWWLAFSRDVSVQHEMEITLGRREEVEPGQRRLLESDPIDRLTGLQSERSFELALELSWFSCARDRRPLALFVFAPDFFDAYLSTFGRIAGDSCLKMVARSVGAAFRRASDVAARLGDVEFAALGVDMELDTLEPHARRVCDRVRALAIRNPHAPLSRTLTVSAVALMVQPGQEPAWRGMLDEARGLLAGARTEGIEQLVVRPYGGGAA
jgi:diguanylate cyclase (GGDEF)-like protein/PAS domain S-box-containing protein